MSKAFGFLRKNFPGLAVLLVSLGVYLYTMAPTVSFWDCGEFITSAFGLQVPHPPGAPLYLILGRVFALLAPSQDLVAWSVNLLSVVASAFTVFFVYKILLLLIEILDRKVGGEGISRIPAEISAVTGALLFAFMDSFWSTAVEAEVYALSLFFAAVTFWAFLRWYVHSETHARFFFLGVYLLGLSLGVHLLNLLLVPVFLLLYGWKRYGHRLSVTLLSLGGGLALTGLLFWGMVVNGLWPAGQLELWLVNNLGLPQHSGLVSWFFFLAGIHVLGLTLLKRKHKTIRFVVLVSSLIWMGWFSYALVPVRASAHPPVNMNNPEHVFSLNDYINRKQYGQRPLLRGPHAWAEPESWKESRQYHYDPGKERYVKSPSGSAPVFEEKDLVWFPRMYSYRSPHPEGYQWWTGFDPSQGKPGIIHQFDFFLRYQMGHQYLRYFLWNFAGRQNDVQGHGDMISGNWATGIEFLDRQFLGSQTYPPAVDQYSSSANFYFGIPLLLALVGLFFLMRRGAGRRRVLLILALWVLMTGPAIVFYLNQPPYEPRERDYIYLASFLGMAMFAALGVLGILKKIFSYGKSTLTGVLSGILLFMAGPGLLFSVNLNDHDRSDRYLALDLAASQLRSCPPGAILFTYGDNDTYPLWYARQVEGIRRDVRIVNLGLLNTSWYNQQIRQAVPGNKGLEMTLDSEFYRAHQTNYFEVSNVISAPLPGSEALDRLDHFNQTDDGKQGGVFGQRIHPVWELPLPNDTSRIWEIADRYVSGGDLALFDIIASNGASRPVCFTRNVREDELKGLGNHLVSRGLVLTLGSTVSQMSRQNQLLKEYEIFRDRISIQKDPKSWWDHTCRQALSLAGYRTMSTSLARRLLADGKREEAARVLTTSLEAWPYSPHADQDVMLDIARLLVQSGAEEKASELVKNISYVNLQDVYFFIYSGFNPSGVKGEYCERFREVRALASDLGLEKVLLETQLELQSMCGF